MTRLQAQTSLMSRLESTFTISSSGRCVISVSGIFSWHPEELLSRFFEVYGGLSWHSKELLNRFFEVYGALSVLLDLQKTLAGTTWYGRHLFFLPDFLLFSETDSPVTLTPRVSQDNLATSECPWIMKSLSASRIPALTFLIMV